MSLCSFVQAKRGDAAFVSATCLRIKICTFPFLSVCNKGVVKAASCKIYIYVVYTISFSGASQGSYKLLSAKNVCSLARRESAENIDSKI